ncbi:hypothetical protein GCM10028806_34750 [Spirosoma terrae]|uniref:Uncharacterized protein n=1 Tax=Spirosoma terrae TaxID=1968276 RepID=A0A6L9LGL7_9BACT|nr:hypothetical protein [Spirosoma terrae]NDU95789.1 hypothetical protein [Spirosoma terrae]
MKIERTFRATIHVGLQEGYDQYRIHDLEEVYQICQEFVKETPSCVSVTPTQYVYVDGQEPGAIVEFIQYPRFPTDENMILHRALTLAHLLMERFKQQKVCVITPTFTYMITPDYEF